MLTDDRQIPDSAGRAISAGGRRLLDLLLKSGGMSQADLTRGLDLAQPTVARLIQAFQKDGVVHLANRRVDRPGNPSVDVALNPDHAYALGIAILGDAVSMLLMDLTGKVRGVRSAAMPSMTRTAVLAKLGAFKADLLGGIGAGAGRVIGAGVGVAGFFIGQGTRINPPRHLAEWAGIDIEPLIEDALALPVMLDNDATAAAVGESLFGVGRAHANFAYMHLSNGFGGALIVDGKAFRGQHGNAGKFGGVWNLCDDGYPNLDRLLACVSDKGRTFATVEEMVQVIDVDTPGVDRWLDEALTPFSKLSSLITAIVDPGRIVLGGRLPAGIAQTLIDRIVIPPTTKRLDLPPPVPGIVVAQIADNPVAFGAAAMPFQNSFFG